MGILEAIGLYVALVWAIVYIPFILTIQIRCIVHDRRYAISLYDAITAVSVVALWARGLPF